MMFFYPMELAPYFKIRSHPLGPGGMWCRYVVQVEYLTLDVFSVGVQERETLNFLPHPFEHGFVLRE